MKAQQTAFELRLKEREEMAKFFEQDRLKSDNQQTTETPSLALNTAKQDNSQQLDPLTMSAMMNRGRV